MKKIAVLIPSLRKDRWGRVRKNIKDTTPEGKIYFGAEEYPSYAKAINGLYKKTTEPYIFCGADDLTFKQGWAEEALKLMQGDIRVVGTNDLHHPGVLVGEHATHYLIDRRYIEEVGGVFDEGPGKILHEYDHNFVDTEFIETARCRKVYAHAHASKVQHDHHSWNDHVPTDEVYKKGGRNYEKDMQEFQRRRVQWLAQYGPPA